MRISDWSSDVCSSDLPLPRSAQLVFVSDFLMPLEDIERALRYYGQGGQRGALLQVLDPAEESLPYDGRVHFDGLEQEPSWMIARADAVRVHSAHPLPAQHHGLRSLFRSPDTSPACPPTTPTPPAAAIVT